MGADLRVFVYSYYNETIQQKINEPLVATLAYPLIWSDVLNELLRVVSNDPVNTIYDQGTLDKCRLFLLPKGPEGTGAEINSRSFKHGIRDNDQFAICQNGEKFQPVDANNHSFASNSSTQSTVCSSINSQDSMKRNTLSKKRGRSISAKMMAMKSLSENGVISQSDRENLMDMLLQGNNPQVEEALSLYILSGETQQLKDVLANELANPSAKKNGGEWLTDSMMSVFNMNTDENVEDVKNANISKENNAVVSPEINLSCNSNFQNSLQRPMVPPLPISTPNRHPKFMVNSFNPSPSSPYTMNAQQFHHPKPQFYNVTPSSSYSSHGTPRSYNGGTPNNAGYCSTPNGSYGNCTPNNSYNVGNSPYGAVTPMGNNSYGTPRNFFYQHPNNQQFSPPNRYYYNQNCITPSGSYQQHPMGYTEYRAPDSSGWVPKYPLPSYPPPVSKEEKLKKIAKWMKKRENRNWSNRPAYPVRHKIAKSRKRGEDGRFITKAQREKIKLEQQAVAATALANIVTAS